MTTNPGIPRRRGPAQHCIWAIAIGLLVVCSCSANEPANPTSAVAERPVSTPEDTIHALVRAINAGDKSAFRALLVRRERELWEQRVQEGKLPPFRKGEVIRHEITESTVRDKRAVLRLKTTEMVDAYDVQVNEHTGEETQTNHRRQEATANSTVVLELEGDGWKIVIGESFDRARE